MSSIHSSSRKAKWETRIGRLFGHRSSATLRDNPEQRQSQSNATEQVIAGPIFDHITDAASANAFDAEIDSIKAPKSSSNSDDVSRKVDTGPEAIERPSEQSPEIPSFNEVKLPLNPNSAIIRVITPESAQRSPDPNSARLLNGGNPIALTMTLRQLKESIGNLLGVHDLRLPEKRSPSSAICNCALARSVAKNGIWEMLQCRIHDSSDEGCGYPHVNASKDGQCLLCHEALSEPCQICQDNEVIQNPCPLISNVGCNHSFHHHCYTEQVGSACPGGCSKSQPLGVSD